MRGYKNTLILPNLVTKTIHYLSVAKWVVWDLAGVVAVVTHQCTS